MTSRIARRILRNGRLVRGEDGELQQFEVFEEMTTARRSAGVAGKTLKFLTDKTEEGVPRPQYRIWHSFCFQEFRHETRTGPSRTRRIERTASCSNRFTSCARFTLNLLPGRFSTPHVVYIRGTALKRCQWKGNRPRGGFRLPWARCRTNPWDG